jgi:saccharopine dehydrogenase-like NADP-dependent oxidoreductase
VRALVLGGYGAVGAEVASQLRTGGDDGLVAAGRDPARADQLVDLHEAGAASYRAALASVDVVVNAAGVEDPALAATAAERGAAFVDTTATCAYVAGLERLGPPRPVGRCRFAPVLTNLLAAAVHDAEPGPIGIALLVGAGERHGAAATAWSYALLGKHFRDPDGRLVRNYTRPRRFALPGDGRRRLSGSRQRAGLSGSRADDAEQG